MDGPALASQLIDERVDASIERHDASVRFRVATRAHDAAIRKLLRETPMAGQIGLSMEREPSYFHAAEIEGSDHGTIVALEDDQLIASGSVSTRDRYINGQARRIGYLSGLRLHPSFRGRSSIIRRGYDLLHRLHQQDGGPELYLTSIVADNRPARRFLERGLSGMPTYRFLGEFVTLVIRRRRRTDFFKPTALTRRQFRKHGLRLLYGSHDLEPAIVDLLNKHNRQYQFGPVWTTDDLCAPALHPEDFRVACSSDGAIACAAMWDQRSMKQAVVRGYSKWLGRFRPFVNLTASVFGRPRLPAVGEMLASAFVSHVVSDPDHPEVLEGLIDLLHGPAYTRKVEFLTLGFDARDPRLPHLRKAFKPREYVSRLYAVHWDDGAALAQSLDDRLMAPEVALL